VVGITLSEQQYIYAQTHFASPDVQFHLQDYRAFNQRFDRVYSLGMFEHVGFKNYSNYFDMVDRCLNSSGLFLLHTIGHRVTSHRVDPWMNRYIFPNSILPSAELITRYSAPTFALQDWHNFGLDYHTTLLAWDRNCRQNWEKLPNYDERFRRMWHYFLMCSAGAFKAGHNQLWQVVFSKGQLTRPYEAVRSAV
jgi:cyclopropane-fatty-acyl-phospholipid synthase